MTPINTAAADLTKAIEDLALRLETKALSTSEDKENLAKNQRHAAAAQLQGRYVANEIETIINDLKSTIAKLD